MTTPIERAAAAMPDFMWSADLAAREALSAALSDEDELVRVAGDAWVQMDEAGAASVVAALKAHLLGETA